MSNRGVAHLIGDRACLGDLAAACGAVGASGVAEARVAAKSGRAEAGDGAVSEKSAARAAVPSLGVSGGRERAFGGRWPGSGLKPERGSSDGRRQEPKTEISADRSLRVL